MKTKINAYLCFNGNCNDALAFYEKAFDAKSTSFRYKDAPPGDDLSADKALENYIMHGEIKLDEDQELYFCDVPHSPPFNASISITLTFDTKDRAKKVFDALSVGGIITMPIDKVFWSEYYGTLIDKFGINWGITVFEH